MNKDCGSLYILKIVSNDLITGVAHLKEFPVFVYLK